MMTKRTTWILVAIAVVVLIAVSVSTAGCTAKNATAPERMFINGTVDDVRYTPVAYNNFATYQVMFSDGRWTVIGSDHGNPWAFDKIASQNLIEKVKIGHECFMLFEKSDDYWNLISVETT